jgi:hypothetical protein
MMPLLIRPCFDFLSFLSDNQLPRITKGLFDGMSILQRLFVDRLQTDCLVTDIGI